MEGMRGSVGSNPPPLKDKKNGGTTQASAQVVDAIKLIC